MFGSGATGEADERSDLDLIVTYTADDVEAEKAILDTVREIIDEAAIRFNVVPEFDAVPESEITEVSYDEEVGDSYKTDPLLAAHLLDIYDRYPGMSHNNPVERMEEIAVDLNHLNESTPEQKLIIAQLAVNYTYNKRGMFRKSYTHSPITDPGGYLDKIQRALETPKAMGRKVLAQLSVDNPHPSSYDVTKKTEMQALLQEAAESHIGFVEGEVLADAQLRLVALDKEYTEVLRAAVKSGEVAEYMQWIHANREEILWAAKMMSEIWGKDMKERFELTKKFNSPRDRNEDLF